ncbi:hypothetical protein A4A49_57376, partial [Nicotiana attenuata]
ILLTIRQARQKIRALFNHPLYVLYSTNIPPGATNSIPAYSFLPSPLSVSSSNVLSTSRTIELQPKDVVLSFKEWFMSRKNPVFDRIFEILKTQDDITADISLSRFKLRLSEALVLHVLNYEKNKDV